MLPHLRETLTISKIKKTVATDPEYTLTLNTTDHLVASDSYKDAKDKNISGYSITNDLGTKFFFHKSNNPAPNLNKENSIVYYGGNADSVIMLRADTDAVEYTHPINGIKSITVDFDFADNLGTTDVSDQIFLNVNYGFVHDGVSYFANVHRLESGVAYNFENLHPTVFNLMVDMSNYGDWYKAYLRSVTIVYSCSPNDTSKEAFLDNYFSGNPIVLETTGEDIPTKIQCGAYPQSLLEDNTQKYYLDNKYSTITPFINEYYIIRGNGNQDGIQEVSHIPYMASSVKLVARAQATNTGYNNEYTIGNNYWFNVDPIEWRVLTTEGDNKYVVASTKVLELGVKYKNNSELNVTYNNSDLKTAMNELAAKILRTTDKIQLNNDFDAKVYALTANQYRAKAAGTEPTAFIRTRISINQGLSTGLNIGYWTNRVGYSHSTQHRAEIIDASGEVDHPFQNNPQSVRPGMIITIE